MKLIGLDVDKVLDIANTIVMVIVDMPQKVEQYIKPLILNENINGLSSC